MFNTTFSPYKNRLQLHTQFPLKLNTFLNPPRNHLIVHIKKSNFQDLFNLFTILPIWKFDLNKNFYFWGKITIHTVWKCHDFSITQVLREINFGDSWSAKSAILTNLEALKFDFYEFFHFLKAEIYQSDKIQSL